MFFHLFFSMHEHCGLFLQSITFSDVSSVAYPILCIFNFNERYTSSVGVYLWTECLCPPKLICWNPHPWCDGVRRWELWELMRSWGCCPHDGISALKTETLQSSLTLPVFWAHSEKMAVYEPGRVLTRTRSCWSQTCSLQSCEEYTSSCKPLVCGVFVIAAELIRQSFIFSF